MPLRYRLSLAAAITLVLFLVDLPRAISADDAPASQECELLIVGGNESAVAAAIEAARRGVSSIILVSDTNWLGGQFSSEGVGCVDEWTVYRGKRVNFPRSGIFLEIMRAIRAHNSATYGVATPGNAWCGSDTIEPAAAQTIFRNMLAPYLSAPPENESRGQITLLENMRVTAAQVVEGRVQHVDFVDATNRDKKLRIQARLTIDSSDFGDVIRASGARYSAGPDLKSRFGEPSAPAGPFADDRNELNPLSWCVVVRHSKEASIITPPDDYDVRKYASLAKTPSWVDSPMLEGIYAPGGWSIYTHRRLVDAKNNDFPQEKETVLLNWPVQDYPLFDFPQRVVDALEALEPGASKKNLVDMTHQQRAVVFEDAKRHALGMFYYLQTRDRDQKVPAERSFAHMKLVSDFGTTDQLPPKPYLRESLRLESLYMIREQDIRAEDRQPGWAKSMFHDALFGFQFNIDFHPTRRKFLGEDRRGPWEFIHTPNRNWHTDTDCAMLPLRSLVPVDVEGLLGTSKNIGVSSIVSSAVRVHGQMTLCGQVSGATAAICLQENLSPRQLAANPKKLRQLQVSLLRGNLGHPGVLIWPYFDLSSDDRHFEAANMLSVMGIWEPDAESLDFEGNRELSKQELATVMSRVRMRIKLPIDAAKLAATEIGPSISAKSGATWGDFAKQLESHGLVPSAGLSREPSQTLLRRELATILWARLESLEENLPDLAHYLEAESDVDSDGILDRDDPLPFARK